MESIEKIEKNERGNELKEKQLEKVSGGGVVSDLPLPIRPDGIKPEEAMIKIAKKKP